MDKSKNLEPMKIWQDAKDIAVPVYNELATTKDFSFCDPIKRVTIATINNIAGDAKRRSSWIILGFSISRKARLTKSIVCILLAALKIHQPFAVKIMARSIFRDFQAACRFRKIPPPEVIQ